MPSKTEAKKALDAIIAKSRIYLYKPIQIAEILYHSRTFRNINPLNTIPDILKNRHYERINDVFWS